MPMRTALPLRSLALCLALLVAAPSARAATLTATLADAAGKPVADTPVTLTDPDGKVLATSRTNAVGAAVFANLPAGRYTLRATTGLAVSRTVGASAAATRMVCSTGARLAGAARSV